MQRIHSVASVPVLCAMTINWIQSNLTTNETKYPAYSYSSVVDIQIPVQSGLSFQSCGPTVTSVPCLHNIRGNLSTDLTKVCVKLHIRCVQSTPLTESNCCSPLHLHMSVYLVLFCPLFVLYFTSIKIMKNILLSTAALIHYCNTFTLQSLYTPPTNLQNDFRLNIVL